MTNDLKESAPAPRPRLPIAVAQPLPGIGDMVWHLPHIRAIAAWAGAPVTLLTKPRSLADQLLADEDAVADIVWLDLNPAGHPGAHDGIAGFVRLSRLLRGHSFASVVILHHGRRLAAAAWAAGIPDRRGYGARRQRMFLNHGPFLTPQEMKLHQHARATRFLQASDIPLRSAEPRLTVASLRQNQVRARLGLNGRFVAIGIGASEDMRRWSADGFGALARSLLEAGWPALVLIGGPGDTAAAEKIQAACGDQGERIRLATGWHLADVAALLSQASFYVGNNTGVMNMAAAVDIRTYALFGTTPV
ncbi:MAG TPA: glycosyltransferase family 9 protein, partial [Rhodopila sp.]|nr:glycosyltransferase family 9 protein [Rhodopila sp.]